MTQDTESDPADCCSADYSRRKNDSFTSVKRGKPAVRSMREYGRREWRGLCALMLCSMPLLVSPAKEKRQIFREQVAPALGGKIPEEAFRTDRLALNRLNKEGITVPDGVVLDARRAHKHPHPSTAMPEVLKVYVTPDGRYVPPEGQYPDDRPKAIDTTYAVQRPYVPYVPYVRRSKESDERSLRGNDPSVTLYKPVVHPLLLPSVATEGDARLYKAAAQIHHLPTSWTTADIGGYPWAAATHPTALPSPTPQDHSLDRFQLFDPRQILLDYGTLLSEFHVSRFLGYVRSNARPPEEARPAILREGKAAPRGSSTDNAHPLQQFLLRR